MTEPPKILGVIPARLDSKRLPEKVLRDIAGKPMLYRVYQSARRSSLLTDLVVATDSEKIRQYCDSQNIAVIMTGRHHSGTDRLYEVMQRTDADIYVNIQGDEPTLRPVHLKLLLEPFKDDETQVTTLKVAIDAESARNPNHVKVVTDNRGRALYFSRSPIPFDGEGAGKVRYYKHIGIYAYRRAALALFNTLPESSLEIAEKLEQMRYLQNGVPIVVVETEHDTIGVDMEADLQRAIDLFSAGEELL